MPVGSQPLGVAVDPDGGRVLVANFADGTLSVIGTASNTVLATMRVGEKPYAVAIHPAGTNAYVTSVTNDVVSVLDAASQSFVARVSVGRNPFGVAVDPGGAAVYVVSGADQEVSVVDAATNIVTATVPVGNIAVGFGQFVGVVTTRCPQPAADCSDGNPFTVDMCSPATGCRHDPLGGDGRRGFRPRLDRTIHSVPMEALGSPDAAATLAKLVSDARGLLAPAPGIRPLLASESTQGTRLARRNLKQAKQKLAAFVRMLGKALRTGTARRDVAETLLDLGRATRARLRHMR